MLFEAWLVAACIPKLHFPRFMSENDWFNTNYASIKQMFWLESGVFGAVVAPETYVHTYVLDDSKTAQLAYNKRSDQFSLITVQQRLGDGPAMGEYSPLVRGRT